MTNLETITSELKLLKNLLDHSRKVYITDNILLYLSYASLLSMIDDTLENAEDTEQLSDDFVLATHILVRYLDADQKSDVEGMVNNIFDAFTRFKEEKATNKYFDNIRELIECSFKANMEPDDHLGTYQKKYIETVVRYGKQLYGMDHRTDGAKKLAERIKSRVAKMFQGNDLAIRSITLYLLSPNINTHTV